MEHRSLLDLARQQHGLFTWRQARDCGYSRWQITSRLGDGRWHRVLGSVLSTVSSLPPSLRDRAALLAGGSGAVLSGPSAARLYGMPITSTGSCVTIPAERHVTVRGVRFLREQVDERDTTLLDDLVVTSRDRTVFDCLRVVPHGEAATLLDRALQKGWITLENLETRVRARRGYPGSVRLQELLDGVTPGARSAAERLTHSVLTDGGITGWQANYSVVVDGQVMALLDVGFPEVKLALEIDGRAWHSAAERFQHDRTRQNRLVNAGWTVLRFTWDDLTQRPHEVVAAVAAALALLRPVGS